MAEKHGRTVLVLGVLVLGVPVEVCDACGQAWLSMEVAKRLDEMFTGMLASEVEIATRHYDAPLPPDPRQPAGAATSWHDGGW